jgi:hypothetical protein
LTRDRTTAVLILLTFVGMVGIYIGAYYAWQKYQAYQANYNKAGGGVLGTLAALNT